ncbi:MAG: site-specific integrase, partial [Polyangiaceae bacterium]
MTIQRRCIAMCGTLGLSWCCELISTGEHHGSDPRKDEADLDLRRFAETTKKEYLRRAQNFVAHYRRPPTELGPAEIREFLTYLVQERKVGAATHHMYVAAIKFLYATTLGRPQVVARIPWP